MLKNKYQKISTLTFAIFCAVFLFQINDAQALTPIARVDVVPYQRIQHNSTFNFGVVAFSKEGIDRVGFTITGQGYSGGIKTAATMTHNPQTDVWEYWVPISSTEFSSNGPITVSAIAYGEDAGTRNIGDTTLIVEGASVYIHTEAWVDAVNGNNSTAQVNNVNLPYQTIAAAVSSAQSANSGSSNGNIIYLENGTYSFSGTTASTSTEWLTIARASGATKENVVINSNGVTTNLLKVDGVTLQSQGSVQYVINSNVTTVWVNDCRLIGSGREVWESYPVAHNFPLNHYSTNNYIYDVDRGMEEAALARNITIERVGNDAFANTGFVVNCVVKDMDPGPEGDHGDLYQAHTAMGYAASNRIIYGLHATDIHMSGIFMRADPYIATNNAFVNVLIEMREPSVPNESDVHDFSPFGIGETWDHLLVWHCSFPLGQSWTGSTIINTSLMGNVFWQFAIADGEVNDHTVDFFEPGNAGNNVALYNHFMHVYGVTGTCTQTSADIGNGSPCPNWYAKIGDSGTSTASVGDASLMLLDSAAETFGMPADGSTLINRIPFATVPADIYGNPRTGNPDVGAVEYISSTGDTTPPSAPSNLSVL